MRNFGYLFGTVAIAAMMYACSDDATNDVTAAGTETATGDVTYLNVSLAMAGSGSLTRADDNYEYGTSAENYVKTCTLLFYDASDNFLTLSELDDDLEWSKKETGENIASTASQVVALSGLSAKPTQVLAIINGTASDYNNESLNNVLAMTVDKNDAELTSMEEGDFIMSNSVYVGGDGTFVYAEPISTDCLYETYEAAEAGDCVTIYVEREVAKVTINVNVNTGDDDSSTSNIEVDEEGTYYAELDGTHIIYIGENATEYTKATFRICIDGWAVNATNEDGYLVKNVSDDWLSDPDFESGTWYKSSDYRTWWAYDDNYDSNESVSYLSWSDVKSNGTTDGYVGYYHENTANYDVQTEYNQPGKDAYTPTLMVAAHVEVSTDEDFSDILDGGNLYYKGGEYYDEDALKYYIAKEYSETYSASVTADAIEITGGEEVKCTINDNEYSAEDLNILEDMEFFEGSACYYQKPISQDITSGDIDDGETTTSEEEKTEYCGLVRNHSYYITLNSITGVGGNIPDKDEDKPEIPGEEETYYLNATINILQWRVVEQEVNF